MSQIQPTLSYREMMQQATAHSDENNSEIKNYYSALSVRTGAIAGLIGATTIVVVITLLTISTGAMDIWLAPRFIASTILGEAAWTGFLPVLLGTTMHLITGALYGVVLSLVTPRIPRAFWFVIALMYSMILWGIAAVILPQLSQSTMMNTLPYTNALILSHLVFGITLGIAASFFGDITNE